MSNQQNDIFNENLRDRIEEKKQDVEDYLQSLKNDIFSLEMLIEGTKNSLERYQEALNDLKLLNLNPPSAEEMSEAISEAMLDKQI